MSVQCCIEGCSIQLEVPSQKQDIIFHEFPKDNSIISQAWLSALGKDSSAVSDKWIVCSKHFGVEDESQQETCEITTKEADIILQDSDVSNGSNVQICRICLATDIKLISISEYNLEKAYEELTGVSLREDNLPKDLCVECAQRLINCSRFRQKSFAGYLTLIEIVDRNENAQFALPKGNFIKRKRKLGNLTSSLEEKVFKTNHFDVSIQVVDTDEETDEVMVLKTDLKLEVEYETETKTDFFDENCEGIETNNFHDDRYIKSDSDDINQINPVNDKTAKVEDVPPNIKKALEMKKLKEHRKILKRFIITDLSYEEQIACLKERKDSAGYKNALHKCTLCYKGFQYKEPFDNHMLRHSDVCGKFECAICHLRYEFKKHLKSHIFSWHTQKYRCKECSFVVSSRCCAILHGRKHMGVRYKCPYCDASYDALTSLLSHVRLKHPSDHVCEQCGYSFIGEKGVTSHKRKAHRLDMKEVPEDGPYCEECNIRFVSLDALTCHRNVSPRHTDDLMYNQRSYHNQRSKNKALVQISCEYCSIVISSLQAYNKHLLFAHNDSEKRKPALRHMCEVCGKLFSSSHALKDHSWIHTGEKCYKCDVCGNSYASKGNLVLHMKIHTRSQMCSCHICGKKFSFRCNLDRHIKHVHTNCRPYKCDTCEKTFKSDIAKQYHFKYVHLKHPWPKRVRGKRTNVLKKRPRGKKRDSDIRATSSSDSE